MGVRGRTTIKIGYGHNRLQLPLFRPAAAVSLAVEKGASNRIACDKSSH